MTQCLAGAPTGPVVNEVCGVMQRELQEGGSIGIYIAVPRGNLRDP